MSKLPDLSLHRHVLGGSVASSLLVALVLPCTATNTEDPSALQPGRDAVRLACLPIGLVTVEEDGFHTSRLRGASLAVADANRAKEAASPGFSLETSGVDGPWQTAAGKARDLLYQQNCLALISPADGDTSHLMVQLAARCQVPVVSLSETSTLTRIPMPWLFRMVPDARQQITALLASIDLPPGGSLAAVVPAGRAGRTLRSDLEALARELSVSFRPLIAVDPTDPKDQAQPDWAEIARLPAGPLLVLLDPDSTRQVLRRLQQTHFQGPVLVPAGRLDDLFESELAAEIALQTIRLFDPTSSGASAFREAYRMEYGQEPDDAAACAYDATRLLIHAIQKAGPERSSIRDWLAHNRHEPGLTGEIAFDGTGNRTLAPQTPTSSPNERTPHEEGQSP